MNQYIKWLFLLHKWANIRVLHGYSCLIIIFVILQFSTRYETQDVFAEQVFQAKSGQIIRATISDNDLTCIEVKNTKIIKAFTAANLYIKKDAKHGRLYILPDKNHLHTFSMFITDEYANSYNLILTPSQKHSGDSIAIIRDDKYITKNHANKDASYAANDRSSINMENNNWANNIKNNDIKHNEAKYNTIKPYVYTQQSSGLESGNKKPKGAIHGNFAYSRAINELIQLMFLNYLSNSSLYQTIAKNINLQTKKHNSLIEEYSQTDAVDMYRGYTIRKMYMPIFIWKDVDVVSVTSYANNAIIGFIYILVNNTKGQIIIEEAQFYYTGILAIAIEKPILEVGEYTAIFVVQEKESWE